MGASEQNTMNLLNHLRFQQQPIMKTTEELAVSSGYSFKQVVRALTRLRRLGLVEIKIVKKNLGGGWINRRYIQVIHQKET